MAKDISKIFSQAIDKFRTEQARSQTRQEREPNSALERDFETVKEQVRKLKPQIETHPRVNHFWIFSDKIIIDFHTSPNQPHAQLIVRLYHPGNHRFKRGMYGYLPDGYEMPLADVDETVEFIATQCGKLLA
ncbi:MAG: hypothetical protein F9K25_09560 [Candidatus Contendobacter sp.]|nr:MAG: hypothetical protein F9K25_09560 [Candidatus Contendobacter sp.]